MRRKTKSVNEASTNRMTLNASGSNSLRATLITEKLTPQITHNPMSARSVHRCRGLGMDARVSGFGVPEGPVLGGGGRNHSLCSEMTKRLYVILLSFRWGKPSFGKPP